MENQPFPQKRIRLTEDEDLLFDSNNFIETENEEEPIAVTKVVMLLSLSLDLLLFTNS